MSSIEEKTDNLDIINEEGLCKAILRNDYLEVVFLPEYGGKMAKLYRLDSGHQYLLDSQFPNGEYKKAEYGAPFDAYDTSGFDECFPTVSDASVAVTEQGHSRQLDFPDHGELWSREWKVSTEGDVLILYIEGIEADYSFEKRIELEEATVKIHYSLNNKEDFDMPSIWSAHPLLKISEGSEIITEDFAQSVVNWASDSNIGTFGDSLSWPVIEIGGKQVDLRKVPDKSFGKTAKLFSEKLKKGVAGLYRQDWDESIVFDFDPAKVPYLGLWLCYGGWPEESDNKHYTLGIEPTTGWPDSLSEAVRWGDKRSIKANSKFEWSLDITIQNGKFDIDDFSI